MMFVWMGGGYSVRDRMIMAVKEDILEDTVTRW